MYSKAQLGMLDLETALVQFLAKPLISWMILGTLFNSTETPFLLTCKLGVIKVLTSIKNFVKFQRDNPCNVPGTVQDAKKSL